MFGQSCDLTVRHKEAYVAFVEKFERKKTTDDCYTPECVYEAVLEWLHEKGINMNKYQVVRPFYPDKDYKLEAYPDSCIVVDNPPFSIISEICRWYSERGIKFFLFAPHLTLFSPFATVEYLTAVVACSDIVYQNGAKVKTSFLSNLFGDIRVMSAPDLHARIKEVQKNKKASLPRYIYPDNVVMVSDIARYAMRGVHFWLHSDEVQFVKALDSQRVAGKSMFGGGFLCSDKAAADKVTKEEAIVWELSEREKEIIKGLG
ncbi:chromosome partitioning protein ParB [Porphyromonas gingivalis]|nr:chromosome partitioning protein ParB [Porphyromonas gingivalis]